MKKKLIAGLAIGLFMFGIVGFANATLISQDLSSVGDGLLTYDTNSGLSWLDITQTLGMSINDVNAELVAGGRFSGFQLASLAQVDQLFTNAGIFLRGMTRPGNLSNVPVAFTDFTNLLGHYTMVYGDTYSEWVWGATSTAIHTDYFYSRAMSWWYRTGDNSAGWSGDIDSNTLYGQEPTLSLGYVGAYLIRATQVSNPPNQPSPVPEPSTMLLLGSGLIGLVALRKKFRK